MAAAGVFVLLRVLLPAGDGPDVVALPAEDSVEAAQLSDGTPVWIVRGSGEDIGVIQALAPETVSGVGELVAWCPAGDRFVAGHHGRSFAPDGRRYTGASPSGLPTDHDVPPADLVTHTWTILEGSSDAGDPLRVGPADPVNHPTELLRPTLRGPLDGLGPPAGCRMDPVVDVPVPSGPAPLDHTAFLAPLQTTRDGWQIVEGNVLVQPDGRAIWCQGTAASGPRAAAPTRPSMSTSAWTSATPVASRRCWTARWRSGWTAAASCRSPCCSARGGAEVPCAPEGHPVAVKRSVSSASCSRAAARSRNPSIRTDLPSRSL